MGRLSKERQEYRRRMVERLLQSDLSVDEWSKRNNVCRGTMYSWLSELAKTEPEVYGGKQNIADTEKRNWLQITRKNIAEASSLALRKPTDVLIVDSDENTVSVKSEAAREALPALAAAPSIQVAIKDTHVAIPLGTPQSDIENVLQVVASL